MPEPSSFARFLLFIGAGLALIGLILWWKLPTGSKLPPYLVTAVLALGFGGYDLWRGRSAKSDKRDDS